MPHVKKQIKIARIAELMSEACDLDLQRHPFTGLAEFFDQESAQRMYSLFGGINDQIGRLFYFLESFTFRADRRQKAFTYIRGVRTSCFRESTSQHVVRGLEEN